MRWCSQVAPTILRNWETPQAPLYLRLRVIRTERVQRLPQQGRFDVLARSCPRPS